MRHSVVSRLERTSALLDILAKKLDPHDRVHPRVPALDRIKNPAARLNFLAELLKAGFNPNQPRDNRGRWTNEGGAPSAGDDKAQPASYRFDATSLRNTPSAYLPVSNFTSHKPVTFKDKNGNVVLDYDKNPMQRPSDVDPGFFVDAGQAAVAADGGPGGPTAYAMLANFARGAGWDVQRVGPERVQVHEFEDFGSVAIGLYAAAAGIPEERALAIWDGEARNSKFSANTVYDSTYTHTPVQRVFDVRRGYDLYRSGQIAPSRPQIVIPAYTT